MRLLNRRLQKLEARQAADRREEYRGLLEEIAARDDSNWQPPTGEELRRLQAAVGIPPKIMLDLFPNWSDRRASDAIG